MPTIQDIKAAIEAATGSDHEYIQQCVREHVQLQVCESKKAALAWEIIRCMDKMWYMDQASEFQVPVAQDKRNEQPVGEYQRMLEIWFTTTVVGDPNPVGRFCNGYGNVRKGWGARATVAQIITQKDLQRVLGLAQEMGLPADKAAMATTLHEWGNVTLPDWAAEVIAAW